MASSAGPVKRKPGYANFAIAEPPLKLVLLENPGQGGTLNHLGVEVADADTVDAEQARRRALGDLHRPGRQPHLLGRPAGNEPARARLRQYLLR